MEKNNPKDFRYLWTIYCDHWVKLNKIPNKFLLKINIFIKGNYEITTSNQGNYDITSWKFFNYVKKLLPQR